MSEPNPKSIVKRDFSMVVSLSPHNPFDSEIRKNKNNHEFPMSDMLKISKSYDFVE